jgi:hypothetical protein
MFFQLLELSLVSSGHRVKLGVLYPCGKVIPELWTSPPSDIPQAHGTYPSAEKFSARGPRRVSVMTIRGQRRSAVGGRCSQRGETTTRSAAETPLTGWKPVSLFRGDIGSLPVNLKPSRLLPNLRKNGYHGWLSFEHEDVILFRMEGMRRSVDLLNSALATEPSNYTLPT